MRIAIIILLLSLGFQVRAQFIQVVDLQDLPIAGVDVIDGETLLGQTDTDGRFDLAPFPDRSDYLHLEHTGFYGQYFNGNFDDTLLRITLYPRIDRITPIYFILGRDVRGRNDIAVSISKLDRKDIALLQPQTTADALGLGDQVYIQKSQSGGGSPMIRGFATNRILLVVDDVRMNTAIFREGNVQNVIAIDPHMIGSTDIIFGPSSLFYGSDAIGGVLSFNTRKIDLPDSGLLTQGNASYRYGSANVEKNMHFDFMVAGPKFGSLTSFSLQQYSELRMGSHGPEEYTQPFYVQTRPDQDGAPVDSLVANPDPNVQRGTGYGQVNFSQRFTYHPGGAFKWDYILHASVNPEVQRFDRLIQPSSGDSLRFAQWNYGPQNWVMNRLQLQYDRELRLLDHAKLTLANQWFTESRIDRRFGSSILREREEEVYANSINLDISKAWKGIKFHYGMEWVHNRIGSAANSEHLESGRLLPIATRYPNGSQWMSTGMYFNAYKRILSWYRTEIGVRYSRFGISGTLDTLLFALPVTDIGSSNGAFTYSFSQKFSLGALQLGLISSSAFRAPNIDDVAKIFDPNPGTVIIPNPDLQPETAYTQELNAEWKWGSLHLFGAVYYTFVDQALNKVNVGTDSLYYDGILSQVQQLDNADQAEVWGLQLELSYDIDSTWFLKSSYNVNRGETSDGEPIRHISPDFGGTHLLYARGPLVIDLYAVYNRSFDYDRFPLAERGDAYLYALNDNDLPYSPSWLTWNFKAQYRFNPQLHVNVGMENIGDLRYRPYASGLSAPGRHFLLALNYRF